MNISNIYVKNPSLTLYAFQLRTDLAQEVVADASGLWERLTQLGGKLGFPELQQLSPQLICYQDGHYCPEGEAGKWSEFLRLLRESQWSKDGQWSFQPVPTKENLKLQGSIFPVRLHDTYAVDLTLFYQTPKVELNELSQLNPQGSLLPSQIQASLGQTWLVYAEPTAGEAANQELAEACVKALFRESPGAYPTFSITEGKLLGSPIFEFEEMPRQNEPNPAELGHILVWLGINDQTLKQAPQINAWLINLLCCRHKILSVYHQSRLDNREARAGYRELERESQQFRGLQSKSKREQVKELTRLHSNMPYEAVEYANRFRNLQDHQTTLIANRNNYEQWLAEIGLFSQAMDNLEFWQKFVKERCSRCQSQLQFDLNYLNPGQQLIRQLTEAVQGISEINSLEQQDELEKLIAYLASILEVTAISVKIDHEYHLPSFIWGDFRLTIADWYTEWGLHLFDMLTHLVTVGLPVGGVLALIFLWMLQKR